jgi:alpha-L-arabinofuranosidase
VNATDSLRSISIQLAGVSNVDKSAKVATLSASTTQSTNSILEPKRIIPVESRIDDAALQFSHALPPSSIQVLELNAK